MAACSLPKERGSLMQRRAERRLARYVCAGLCCIAGFVCIGLGGTLSRNVDVAIEQKYQDLIVSSSLSDPSPPVGVRVCGVCTFDCL